MSDKISKVRNVCEEWISSLYACDHDTVGL